MPTGQPIELSYARQLVKNFQEDKLDRGQILTDDTRAVWFSKEVLLEALGASPNAGAAEISGIRIYFGAYQEEPGYPESPYDRNKLTLVLVQTGQDSIQITRDGVDETAFLDIIDNPDTQPSYPTSPEPAENKNYSNEGQCYPPPGIGAAQGLGLMEW